jgi:hypothetical protein
MSWDLTLFHFARPVTAANTIADDEPLLPLGSLADVHERVSRHFPGTDWSDPGWGRWETEWDSIEFNLGDEDPADCLMLHVRAGPDVIPRIQALCRENGWHCIDCASGGFLSSGDDG